MITSRNVIRTVNKTVIVVTQRPFSIW